MFLPTTRAECRKRGWHRLDVIIVTGDTYIDAPSIGAAVIGKTLVRAGYKVGIIAQPDIHSKADITRLGAPKLFWGITAGAVDSMVANYTATGRRRKQDDYTPGGSNNRRPDRAVIAYTNLVKRFFKTPAPIVLGGIEASLRRVAHFDFQSHRIRRSILFDAKADYLIYGMGEAPVTELAAVLKGQLSNPDTDRLSKELLGIRGLCHITPSPVPDYIKLPDYEAVNRDTCALIQSFHLFYRNNDGATARGLVQKQDGRYLVQNPPPPVPDTHEMDRIHDLSFEREVHPFYAAQGTVRAMETIRFSILTHRGCYGECNFCAIAVHEGRTVRWRSRSSIIEEARSLTCHPKFKGIISDVGGATANMYGFECAKKQKSGPCPDKRCLFPQVCKSLKPEHDPQIRLLQAIRALKGVKKVFVASGIRYDLILADKKRGPDYLEQVIRHHVSGQMKLAPEHTVPEVLALMGKPEITALSGFKKTFERITRDIGKEQYLTYYLMAAHPGCTLEHMKALKQYAGKQLKIRPEQVQVFTPTPATYSTLMYATGENPFTGRNIFVETDARRRMNQKSLLTGSASPQKRKARRPGRN